MYNNGSNQLRIGRYEYQVNNSMSSNNVEKPLYVQVKDFVTNYIADKNLYPGDPLPTEVELMDMLHVSRTTLRNALDILQSDGLISKQQGRGTFVANPRYEENLTSLSSFTEDVTLRGQSTSSVVLSNQLIIPPSDMALDLQISCKDPVFFLERLRKIDNKPVQIAQTYLPKKYLLKLDLTKIDFTNESLYKVLIEAGVNISTAEEVIEASISNAIDCALLNLPENSPILVNRRKLFNDNNQVIEMSYCRSAGSIHKVKIGLRR